MPRVPASSIVSASPAGTVRPHSGGSDIHQDSARPKSAFLWWQHPRHSRQQSPADGSLEGRGQAVLPMPPKGALPKNKAATCSPWGRPRLPARTQGGLSTSLAGLALPPVRGLWETGPAPATGSAGCSQGPCGLGLSGPAPAPHSLCPHPAVTSPLTGVALDTRSTVMPARGALCCCGGCSRWLGWGPL